MEAASGFMVEYVRKWNSGPSLFLSRYASAPTPPYHSSESSGWTLQRWLVTAISPRTVPGLLPRPWFRNGRHNTFFADNHLVFSSKNKNKLIFAKFMIWSSSKWSEQINDERSLYTKSVDSTTRLVLNRSGDLSGFERHYPVMAGFSAILHGTTIPNWFPDMFSAFFKRFHV